ncbi:uncharacterized protein [Salmo salar]|uniref:Tc1-like transposase DDE domain-containing protein n=1 Tax=Salmo salar TaxID=8030 RepID=A0ABM3DAA0_SALSA|nr:uncharacterized protein LOC123728226 [Salmo salar]
MKQLYKVPFERNSQRNKEVRRAYVDGVLEMDAHAIPHEFIFIDEAGFNLAKTRRRGRNVIGHRAIIDVPGQRGGNITMCAAISNTHSVLHRHANLGPYNTAHILTFLDRLHNILIPPERMNDADHQRTWYVVAWDNVSFHRAAPVQNWFADHPPFLVQYLPPYSPFLNPIEELFSAWRWKVYDRQPFVRMPLVQAMEEACDEIDVGAIQGWIRHSRRFFPRCLYHNTEEEISLVRQHRDEIRELQCAMTNVEEDNQALRMEVRRPRENCPAQSTPATRRTCRRSYLS